MKKARRLAPRLISLLLVTLLCFSTSLSAFAAETDPKKEYTNVALGKTVTATSVHTETTYFSTDYLTDGINVDLSQNNHVGWSSAPGLQEDDPVDLLLDLGKVYSINQVTICPMAWEAGKFFPVSYEVFISEDGAGWTKVGQAADLDSAEVGATPQVYSFAETNAAQVKIHITKNRLWAEDGSVYSQIGEIEVNGYAGEEEPTPPEPVSTAITKTDDAVVLDFTDESIIDHVTGSKSRYQLTYDPEGYILTDPTKDRNPYFGILIPKDCQFSADEYKYMKVCYKTSAPTTDSCLYWSSNPSLDTSSDDVYKFKEYQITNDGEWHSDLLQFTEKNYTGNVQYLRLAPFEDGELVQNTSTIQVKYYAFFKTREAAIAFDAQRFNVALNAKVEAGDSQEEPTYYSAGYLTDGLYGDINQNTHLGWTTTEGKQTEESPVDVVLDLGALYAINQVSLYPILWESGKFFPVSYTVSVSADKGTWTQVGSAEELGDVGTQPQVYSFPDKKARYVKVHITKHRTRLESNGKTSIYSQISEIEVNGYYLSTGAIQINKPALRMNPGATDLLKIETDIPSLMPKVTWSSDDESVAVIDPVTGRVTAVDYGTTVLRGRNEAADVDYICNILVDDHKPLEKFMISTFRSPSKDNLNAKSYDLLKDCYITNVQNEWNTGTNSVEDNMLMAQLAYERGMEVTVAEAHWRDGFVGLSYEEIQSRVEKYTHVPGVCGFYILDEPGNPNPFAHAYEAIHDLMPTADIHLNMLPFYCYPNDTVYKAQMNDWVQSATPERLGYLMYDFYPFIDDGTDYEERRMMLNMESFREVGLKTGVNTGSYIQSIGRYKSWEDLTTNGLRIPSEGDLRLQVNYSLAYGQKQIAYFCWETPIFDVGSEAFTPALVDRYGEPTPLYYSACKINKAVTYLGPTLMKLDAIHVYLAGKQYDTADPVPEDFFIKPASGAQALVSYMRHRETGVNYAMIVNRDNVNNYTFRFTTDSAIDAIQEVSQTTGELVPVTKEADGSYSIELLPGEGRLFKMPDSYDYTPGYGVFTAPKAGTNAAQNAVVSGSSSVGTDGWYYNSAVDGVRFGPSQEGLKGWQGNGSKNNQNASLVIDLGGVQPINRVDLYPVGNMKFMGESFPVDYTIDVSTDGQSWNSVVTVTGQEQPKLQVPSFDFAQVSARYVRVNITKMRPSGNGYCAQISEVEVYQDDGSVPPPEDSPYAGAVVGIPGTNIAPASSPICSSTLNQAPYWNIEYINDGVTYEQMWQLNNAGWSSGNAYDTPDNTEWIGYNFGSVQRIDKVVVYPTFTDPPESYPIDYYVEVSKDGGEWTTVYNVVGDTTYEELRPHVLEFDPVEAQYIRFVATKLSHRQGAQDYRLQLSELEVYVAASDKAALQDLYESNKDKTQGNYTDESWNTFTAALEAAKAVLDNEKATQAQVDAASKALEQAIADLKAAVSEVDKSALQAQYDANKEKQQGNYTDDSWQAFQTALAQAKAVLDQTDATQRQVDAAVYTLALAVNGLEKTADMELLRLAIALGDAEDTAGCTPSSVKALTDALEAGRALLGEAQATQEQVNEAVKEIFNALINLADQANKARLTELVDTVGQLTESKYTAQTWQALQEALAEANRVLADGDAKQPEVDGAYKALLDAMLGLQLKGDVAVNKGNLKLAIDLAKPIVDDAERYVSATIEGLAQLLSSAQALYDNPDATQSAVDQMAQELLTAASKARLKANKTGLEAAVTQANAIDLQRYTEPTAEVFSRALAQANLLLQNEALSEDDQKLVDDAQKALVTAMQKLVAKGDSPTSTPNTPSTGDGGLTGPFMLVLLGIAVSMACLLRSIQRKRKA